jgi:lipoate-protein ligase B
MWKTAPTWHSHRLAIQMDLEHLFNVSPCANLAVGDTEAEGMLNDFNSRVECSAVNVLIFAKVKNLTKQSKNT